MSDKSEKNAVMSSRQAAELDFAFERNRWSSADVKALAGGDTLRSILLIVRRQGKVVQTAAPLIDCNGRPYKPDGYKVETHIQGGMLAWDPARILEYLAAAQMAGSITGNELYTEALKGKPILNACVLDWLLAHPEFIPNEWDDGKQRYFWGTIYRDKQYGKLVVRRLFVSHCNFGWGTSRLDDSFKSTDPALLAA